MKAGKDFLETVYILETTETTARNSQICRRQESRRHTLIVPSCKSVGVLHSFGKMQQSRQESVGFREFTMHIDIHGVGEHEGVSLHGYVICHMNGKFCQLSDSVRFFKLLSYRNGL